MRGLIGFVIITNVLLLLLPLSLGVLRVTIITLPTSIAAVSIMLLILYLFRVNRVNRLNSHGTLARMLVVQFDGQRLHWDLEESQIERYAKARLATFISILAGISSIWVILIIINKKYAFNDLTRVSSDVKLVMCFIISGIVVVATSVRAKPVENLKDAIWERAGYLVRQTNTQLERIKELVALETSIKSIAYQLKVSFPVDFNTEIREFINTHKNELLSDTADLNKLISKNIEQAHGDRIHLEKAKNLYRAAMKLYTVVAIEVNWTGSMPLIKEMEYDYEGLTSENLKFLLVVRKWDDFRDIVNEIMIDLQRMRELAIKYQEEGFKDEANGYRIETEEEKAYRIMEISPAASDEEIKHAYRQLALNYHPDNAEQTTRGIKKLAEERFKEINWAYDFLKEIRQF